MTPEQRRAHLVLHGQTLLDAWQARTKLCAEGLKLLAEGLKLLAEANRLGTKGVRLWAEGSKLWTDAVAAEFGPDCTITWQDGTTCILGCGETYQDIETPGTPT